MNVVLFKNCIVNNSYDILFDNILKKSSGETLSPFEKYLATLSSKTLFNLDDENKIYFDLPIGQLQLTQYDIDDVTKVNEYNYLYITGLSNNTSLTRSYYNAVDSADTFFNAQNLGGFNGKVFCFIDSVSIENNIAYVNYSVDYFHTYSNMITTFNGIVERTNEYLKLPNGTANEEVAKVYKNKIEPVYKYPVVINNLQRFDKFHDHSNNMFSVIDFSKNPETILIVSIQVFNLDAQGEYTDRYTLLTLVNNFDTYNFNQSKLDEIVSLSSTRKVKKGNNEKNYEILEAHIVPVDILSKEMNTAINNLTDAECIFYIPVLNSPTEHYINFYSMETTVIPNAIGANHNKPTGELFRFKNEMNLKKFGLFSKMFDNNYLSEETQYIDFNIRCSRHNLFIYMRYQCQVENVTSLFKVEPTIEPNNPVALELAKYNRQYNNKVLDLGVYKSGVGLATGVLNTLGGVALGVATGGSGALMGGSMIGGGLTSSINNIFDLVQNQYDREKNNAELYTSNESRDMPTETNFQNIYCGVIFLIEQTPINQTQIDQYNNDFGLEIDYKFGFNEFIRSFIINDSNKLHFFKFNDVRLNGLFDNNVAKILKEIFKKGYKLVNYYNYNDFITKLTNGDIF